MSAARSEAFQGNKINAVKIVRENMGLGLKEAKDMVDSWG
ncbi:MAG TPA: ribosomal protein L7/L12 [Thermoanaerobaculia bacterium]|jgi:ribosomal protein L7/L12|nr:ribosomal protein L7/L12 [Thermoanaerobaculia bacterium]